MGVRRTPSACSLVNRLEAGAIYIYIYIYIYIRHRAYRHVSGVWFFRAGVPCRKAPRKVTESDLSKRGRKDSIPEKSLSPRRERPRRSKCQYSLGREPGAIISPPPRAGPRKSQNLMFFAKGLRGLSGATLGRHSGLKSAPGGQNGAQKLTFGSLRGDILGENPR